MKHEILTVTAASPRLFLAAELAESTASSPVGYLEGIFLLPEFRGLGLSALLLKACEAWAAEQGCQEFASDCELENETSIAFHKRSGFKEAGRIVCFVKQLNP